MMAARRITVTEAAKEIGVAASTVYGMVARGELTRYPDGASILLDPREVAKVPRRGRGRQRGPASELAGAEYARLREDGMSVSEIAARYQVTHQAVSSEIAYYRQRERATRRRG